MKVPLLDLKAQLAAIEPELKAAINEVIDSTAYIMGPQIDQLEKKIAEYSGAGYGIGVTSGTDALLLALMGLDVTAGDIVITTPYSFFASAGVIARLGATPVFVDIDPKSFNMNPAALREWFTKEPELRKKVKAIIPVHLYGQSADMDGIMAVADEYKIPVIEDAAQAIGTPYPSKNGIKKAGSMGLMGCFSFFPSKNLGCLGDGGMIVTSDEKLAQKLKKLRNHGAQPKYYHALIGGNFRIDTIQAAALLVKLPHLEKWHAQRRKNAEVYDSLIKIDGVETPRPIYGRENHIYNQYVIMVNGRRDELRTFLQEQGVSTEVYYPVPFHEQECFKYLNIAKGTFPHSEHAARHSLALPIYPEVTREMQEYVVKKLEEFYA